MITPFRLFSIYTPIRLHFTTEEFNALKYNINNLSTITKETFDKRHDVRYFEGWCRNLNDPNQALDYCIFNFANGEENWFYNEQQTAKDTYLKTKGYFAALTKNLNDENVKVQQILDDKNITFKTLINITEKGNRPPLLQMVLKGNISKEFVCLIDNGFLDRWDKLYERDPYISRETLKLRKYKQFVKIIAKRTLSVREEIT